MNTKKTLFTILLFMMGILYSYGTNEGFRKYPYILLKENSVTIMWQLYSNLNCTFHYKKSVSYHFKAVQVNDPYNTDDLLYKYELTDLDPSVLYDFKVVIEITTYPIEKTGSFISPPDSTETQISFYGYGDTRGDEYGGEPPFHDEVCCKVIDEINNDPTSQTLIIHSGDWNYDDYEEMWDSQYFLKKDENAVEMRTKIGVVGCIGNHEANYGNAPNYRKYWPYDYPDVVPDFWHSFDYGPVHFCFADQRWQNFCLQDAENQKNWIKSDLEESNKPWKILVFHPPVYTCSINPNDYNCEKDFFDVILNDTETYGVNIVLNGHIHKYSNWLVNGVHHLTLGGGGAIIRNEDPSEVDDFDISDIIRWQTNWHFAKFEVHNDYIKVEVPYYKDDISNWDILDEFIIPHSFVIKEGEDIVWEDHGCHYYADNIRVETGAVLTIKGDVEFQRDGGIIVEPGGKLVVDNALLTCLGDFNNKILYWQGIQVWGNSSVHQFEIEGQCAQGKLILNNAIIENAVSAVELWRPDHWGTQGGIVFADNTIFRNNAKSVHALHYQNYNPDDPSQEMDYLNNFKECTFEITEEYSGIYTFYKHIDLNNVKGIKFEACDFTLADVPGVSQSNKGIAAYNAGFNVSAVCNSDGIPYSFSGFYNAIYATGTNSNTFSVSNAVFENNTYGIKVEGVNNTSILFSDFFIGHNAADEGECEGKGLNASGYGIDLINCIGFAVEENYFTKYAGAPSGNYIGIRVKDSQTPYDLIYFNTFDGLSYGNFAEGNNRSCSNELFGLEFQCNNNTGNNIDFIVTGGAGTDPQIRTFQGTQNVEAGNIFSSNAQWHFKNDGTQVIYYFYYNNPPVNYTPDYVVPIVSDDVNICPSHYGGDGSGGGLGREVILTPEQKQLTEQDFAANLAKFNNVKALFDNLKDGGNTEALQNEVEMSLPQDIWELRAELLGKSPHLSKEVLMTAADKTDVLPESVLFAILSANPDELRKEELINYLENKDQPLPDYMIAILRQLAGGITYKTILLQEMARYNGLKTQAAYDLIRSSLNDSVTDYQYLRNWLDNLNNMNADIQIVSTYVSEGDFASAQSLLDIISGLYMLEGEALNDYNDYKSFTEMQIMWQQQGRNIFQLDSTEVATLVDYADNTNGKAAVAAQGILEFGYGYNYFNCTNINGTSVYKNSNFNMDDFTRVYGIEISVKPNPAREWTAFNYQLPDDMSKGVIEITDVYGKLIETIAISGNQGQRIWDTRNTKSGVYFFNLNLEGFSKIGKIVISK
jgi:hypothetical protein